MPLLNHDPQREESELRAYLGDEFASERLRNWERIVDEELAEVGDELAFYRTSQAYLYNLTVFAMSPTKLPYLDALVRAIPAGARVLDLGCGIGSDGLLLLEAGYRVEFADYANPCTEYLRWRMKRRGLNAAIHNIDEGVPGGFEAGYSLDVIEHVSDPFTFLSGLEQRAAVVCVNLLEPIANDVDVHHELPIARLLRHVAAHPLISYEIHHGRSHLMLYRSRPASVQERLAAAARIGAITGRRRLKRAWRATMPDLGDQSPLRPGRP